MLVTLIMFPLPRMFYVPSSPRPAHPTSFTCTESSQFLGSLAKTLLPGERLHYSPPAAPPTPAPELPQSHALGILVLSTGH